MLSETLLPVLISWLVCHINYQTSGKTYQCCVCSFFGTHSARYSVRYSARYKRYVNTDPLAGKLMPKSLLNLPWVVQCGWDLMTLEFLASDSRHFHACQASHWLDAPCMEATALIAFLQSFPFPLICHLRFKAALEKSGFVLKSLRWPRLPYQ